MRTLLAFLITFILVSCESGNDKPIKSDKPEQLIEVKNGVYSEWYPGKKQLKFHGALDKKGNRNGKWVFYSDRGTELSITVYENGKRQGFSIVKYPNGAIHYRGEYLNDTMIGIWTTYNEKGKVITEKDYGLK